MSKTHRVDLAWCAEVVSAENCEMPYIESEHQFADILTKFAEVRRFVGCLRVVLLSFVAMSGRIQTATPNCFQVKGPEGPQAQPGARSSQGGPTLGRERRRATVGR